MGGARNWRGQSPRGLAADGAKVAITYSKGPTLAVGTAIKEIERARRKKFTRSAAVEEAEGAVKIDLLRLAGQGDLRGPGHHGQFMVQPGSDRHAYPASGDWAVPQWPATALDSRGMVE